MRDLYYTVETRVRLLPAHLRTFALVTIPDYSSNVAARNEMPDQTEEVGFFLSLITCQNFCSFYLNVWRFLDIDRLT